MIAKLPAVVIKVKIWRKMAALSELDTCHEKKSRIFCHTGKEKVSHNSRVTICQVSRGEEGNFVILIAFWQSFFSAQVTEIRGKIGEISSPRGNLQFQDFQILRVKFK